MVDDTPTVAILGAGVAGLCMGIRLKQAGIHSFTIYEVSRRVDDTSTAISVSPPARSVPTRVQTGRNGCVAPAGRGTG